MPETDPQTQPPQPNPTQENPPPEPPKAKSDEDNYWKRKAEKHEAELTRLKRAQMSDAERLQAERDEAKREADQARAEARQVRQQNRFESAAAKAGCLDPELAFKAIDSSKLGDNGENADKLVEELRKSKPHLFKPSNLGGSGGVTGGPPSSPNQAINDRIRRFARGEL